MLRGLQGCQGRRPLGAGAGHPGAGGRGQLAALLNQVALMKGLAQDSSPVRTLCTAWQGWSFAGQSKLDWIFILMACPFGHELWPHCPSHLLSMRAGHAQQGAGGHHAFCAAQHAREWRAVSLRGRPLAFTAGAPWRACRACHIAASLCRLLRLPQPASVHQVGSPIKPSNWLPLASTLRQDLHYCAGLPVLGQAGHPPYLLLRCARGGDCKGNNR